MEEKNWNPKCLTDDQAKSIIYEDSERFNVIEDKVTGNSRWSIYHDAIIEDTQTGKFYSTNYSVGSTEQQDESPYDYEEEVNFIEVQKVQIQSFEWKVV